MKSLGKSVVWTLFVFVLISLAACEKSGNDTTPVETVRWTWFSGNETVNQTGVYGTKGTAAASNIPGGRENGLSWRDASGKLWLFGGYGHDRTGFRGQLNDLWTFDPAAGQWTWVSGSDIRNQAGFYGTVGIPSPSSIPGARGGAVSWIDTSGRLWLFAGSGYSEDGEYGYLNDLWTFDPATGEWTWAAGGKARNVVGIYGTQGTADPSNVPGARSGAVSWIDSQGVLWVFGGYGYDSDGAKGWLNDLWTYDPSIAQWTWVSGSDTMDQKGTYGTLGTADAANVPGGRYAAVSWLDSGGHLWLFGGDGLDSNGERGDLSDLWSYDPTTLQWTWIAGDILINQSGSYGTQGAGTSTDSPGGRFAAVNWLDADGRLWLFGGCGRDIEGSRGWLNDLWRFDPADSQWTWLSGSAYGGQRGVYGIKGTAAEISTPGARNYTAAWIDAQDKLWLFGGYGLDSAGDGGWLNDLWSVAQ